MDSAGSGHDLPGAAHSVRCGFFGLDLVEAEDGARRGIRTPDQLGVKGLLYMGIKSLIYPVKCVNSSGA